MAFLLFDAERGGGTGNQTAQTDGVARGFTEAVSAIGDAVERAVDFVNQLAFAVADALFQYVFFFLRGAVGFVRRGFGFLQVHDGCLTVFQQLAAHGFQTGAEKFQLLGVHVVVFGHRQKLLFSQRAGSFCGVVHGLPILRG